MEQLKNQWSKSVFYHWTKMSKMYHISRMYKSHKYRRLSLVLMIFLIHFLINVIQFIYLLHIFIFYKFYILLDYDLLNFYMWHKWLFYLLINVVVNSSGNILKHWINRITNMNKYENNVVFKKRICHFVR